MGGDDDEHFDQDEVEQSQPLIEQSQFDAAESEVQSSIDHDDEHDDFQNDIACDGCGWQPIIGIRYKCSVCQEFNLCRECKERKGHPHAFLKIKQGQEVPLLEKIDTDDKTTV